MSPSHPPEDVSSSRYTESFTDSERAQPKAADSHATDYQANEPSSDGGNPLPSLPMKHSQLKHYLPHRYPFMLVDRVTDYHPNIDITGYKNVTINEPFFQGHFPSEPIMPGVLIIEALAQLAGVLAFISAGVTYEDGYLFLFAGVDKVRFKQQVLPGDQLQLTAQLTLHKQDVYKFNCHSYVEGTLVNSAQITLVRQTRPPKHALQSELTHG